MVRTKLFCHTRASRTKTMRLAVAVASSMLLSPAFSQSPAQAAPPASASAPAAKSAAAGTPIQYHATKTPTNEVAYYRLDWGVDSFSVKAVESGELIRFSYRVVDPDRAKPINDKTVEAFMIAPAARVKLSIPSLEKVGQLRQSSTPIAGNSYWMAFSNPGRPVKRGDRVNIEIGQFHVEGLVVQ
jgi:hypothetical protein